MILPYRYDGTMPYQSIQVNLLLTVTTSFPLCCRARIFKAGTRANTFQRWTVLNTDAIPSCLRPREKILPLFALLHSSCTTTSHATTSLKTLCVWMAAICTVTPEPIIDIKLSCRRTVAIKISKLMDYTPAKGVCGYAMPSIRSS